MDSASARGRAADLRRELAYALRRSLPMLVGFFPIGVAYGVLMEKAGYNFLWCGFVSVTVLAGSLQYLMIDFFKDGTPLLTVAVMALLLNSRHIFYGLSFIDEFKKYGPWKYLMIYTLADENYSLLCSYEPRDGLNEKRVKIMTSSLVAIYWISFTIVGGLAGSLLTFDTTGIDFALTAMFVVILVDQLREAASPLPALVAVASGVICILIFGADGFILPSLALTVAALILLRPRLEKYTGEGK